MRVKHITIFLILVLILSTSTACGTPSISASGASPTPPSLAAAQMVGTSLVSAEGEVVPVKQTSPSFEVTGRLVVKSGKVMLHGNKPPYGYRLEDGMLVIYEPETRIVRLIYTWYVSSPVTQNQAGGNAEAKTDR